MTIHPQASATSSDILETPPPNIPSTVPTTFVMATQIVDPSTCCVTYNVTAPAGPWALILLNYTGSVQGQVYDSSFHAMVDGVPVLFGTTPELYQWTVLKDLTEYSALFEQPAVFQFVLGAATVGGHFYTSLSLSFYPVPPGYAPPPEPNQVVPVWPFTTLSASRLAASASVTVPTNVTNATLELYAYGFSGSGADEFWYSTFPAYRAVRVSVDGAPLATVQPFEFVNTGGLDLFLWDPVTAAYTVNDPPYQVDVTAALGLLEGSHTLNASIAGLGHGSNWFVAASLLLYTSPAISGATLNAAPAPVVSYSNGSMGGQTEHAGDAYSFASTLHSSAGDIIAASWTNETFDGKFTSSGNASASTSGIDVRAVTQFQERLSSPAGQGWVNATSRPSIQFQVNQTAVVTSTTGGGYPIYENITYRMLSFHQNWNLTRTDVERSTAGTNTVSGASRNDNVSANGSYEGQEELISPAAAQLLKIYWFWSNTTKLYASSEVQTPLTVWYRHLLVAALTPADLATDRAAVTTNQATFVDGVAIRLAKALTDVHGAQTLTATALGVGAPFTFHWLNLPNGCGPGNPGLPSLTCAATVNGSFLVSVTATGSLGDYTISPAVNWTILPDPTAAVTAAVKGIDNSQSVLLRASISGGQGPFVCHWFASGNPINPPGACPLTINYTPPFSGVFFITLNGTDSLTGAISANTLRLDVSDPPGVEILLVRPSATIPTVHVGSSIGLTTQTSPGTIPDRFAWFEDGIPITQGVSGGNLTYTPTTSGTKLLTVTMTDAAGMLARSNPVTVDVLSTSGGHNGTGSGSGFTLSETTDALIGFGVVVVLLVVLVVVLVRRRRPPPRRTSDPKPKPRVPRRDSIPSTPPKAGPSTGAGADGPPAAPPAD
ncbi:MAG: hypothetical protein L3J93_05140 [Thermoplasmata archaeon]|nr:hypothetical protein [Thermoplasmata archaeon]